jgi:hypothetical protein
MYEHKKCTDAGEQIEVCAMTYIKVIDNLYNGTKIVLDELIEWPAWPSPSSREYVAPLDAKKRANDTNNLRSHGMTVLRECRKLEAVLDDLRHHYGGKFPSGWEAPDKLRHVMAKAAVTMTVMVSCGFCLTSVFLLVSLLHAEQSVIA